MVRSRVFVVTPLAVVIRFFIFGFVGKESDAPNEGSGEGQACRSFSEARCVVPLFLSSVRQEILINWVRAELSVLARVSSGVARSEFVGRPHLCPGLSEPKLSVPDTLVRQGSQLRESAGL